MKKESNKQASNKNKQVVKFPFIKHLLKKRPEKQVIPESQLNKKLKFIK